MSPAKVWPLRVSSALLGEAISVCVHGFEPPSRNAADKMHWSKRHKLTQDIQLMLRSSGPLKKFTGPVTIDYVRTHQSTALDEDNLKASFKPVGDALVRMGVIADDKPAIVHLHAMQTPRMSAGPWFSVSISPRIQ